MVSDFGLAGLAILKKKYILYRLNLFYNIQIILPIRFSKNVVMNITYT